MPRLVFDETKTIHYHSKLVGVSNPFKWDIQSSSCCLSGFIPTLHSSPNNISSQKHVFGIHSITFMCSNNHSKFTTSTKTTSPFSSSYRKDVGVFSLLKQHGWRVSTLKGVKYTKIEAPAQWIVLWGICGIIILGLINIIVVAFFVGLEDLLEIVYDKTISLNLNEIKTLILFIRLIPNLISFFKSKLNEIRDEANKENQRINDKVDVKFDETDVKFDKMEGRFDGVDDRLDELHEGMKMILHLMKANKGGDLGDSEDFKKSLPQSMLM